MASAINAGLKNNVVDVQRRMDNACSDLLHMKSVVQIDPRTSEMSVAYTMTTGDASQKQMKLEDVRKAVQFEEMINQTISMLKLAGENVEKLREMIELNEVG